MILPGEVTRAGATPGVASSMRPEGGVAFHSIDVAEAVSWTANLGDELGVREPMPLRLVGEAPLAGEKEVLAIGGYDRAEIERLRVDRGTKIFRGCPTSIAPMGEVNVPVS